MAPTRRASGPRASGQQKLSFTSSKPSASAANSKKKSTTSISRKQTETPPPAPIPVQLEDDTSSEEELDEVKTPTVSPKLPTPVKRAKLDEGDKAGQYKQYWKEAEGRMGHQAPIHGKDESKVFKMLRVFDLSYEFGPCIGMSRLERWERAEAMGLEPPADVREILMTEEGNKDPRLAQCIFFEIDA